MESLEEGHGVAPVHEPGAADLDAAAAAAAARAELGLAADAAVVVYAGDAVSLL